MELYFGATSGASSARATPERPGSTAQRTCRRSTRWRPPDPVEAGGAEPPETWDAFFSDFYLRAYADDERQGEAEAQALAAAQLAGARTAATCSTSRAASAATPCRSPRAGYRVIGVDRWRRCSRRRSAARATGAGPSSSGRLPRAAVPRRELRRRAQPVHLARLPRRRGGHARAGRDPARAAPGGRLMIEILHRDLLVRNFREQDWRLSARAGCCSSSARSTPRGRRPTTQTLIEAAASASRARTRCASTRRRSWWRCSTARASRRPAATATSRARRSTSTRARGRRDQPVTVNDCVSSRRRAVARVDVDPARLDDELAAVVVEAEVAPVERERDRPLLAGRERHALEPAQPPDRLRDARHGVVEVQLHDLVARSVPVFVDVDRAPSSRPVRDTVDALRRRFVT